MPPHPPFRNVQVPEQRGCEAGQVRQAARGLGGATGLRPARIRGRAGGVHPGGGQGGDLGVQHVQHVGHHQEQGKDEGAANGLLALLGCWHPPPGGARGQALASACGLVEGLQGVVSWGVDVEESWGARTNGARGLGRRA